VNRNGHVVLAGDDQTEIAGVSLLKRYEVFKKLATAFVRVNAATVKQVRRRRPLWLAHVRLDRHRNDSSRQVAPELLAHALFRRRQPYDVASTARRVFVRRKIRGQFVVQCRCEQCASSGNLLETEVRCRVQVGDENERAVVAPVLVEIAQQRLRVRALMTNEVFL